VVLAVSVAACGRTEVVRETSVVTVMADAGLDGGSRDAGIVDGGSCAPGFVLQEGRCVEVVASLLGLRWELPCLAADPDFPELICFTHLEVATSATVLGVAGRSYDVRVRVRGVVETRAYVAGVPVAAFVRRGVEANPSAGDAWNVYRLEVSDPPERWALNHGASGEYECHAVDTTFSFRVRAGATVRLFASSVDARRSQIRNRSDAGVALVIDGVRPAPMPFDGQFLQLDVLSVTAAP
jgi:hypothetical protein